MAEAAKSSHAWWDFTTAVSYLRDGSIPATIARWSLLGAVEEIQRLNAAFQNNDIEARGVLFSGKSRMLKAEEKARIALRFRRAAFLGGVGITTDILDRDTGEKHKDIKRIELKAADIQTLVDSFDPFKSGGPGRPTAKEHVFAEGKRRIQTGEVVPRFGGYRAFCKDLEAYWEAERKKRPHAPTIKAHTIEGNMELRSLYNRAVPSKSSS